MVFSLFTALVALTAVTRAAPATEAARCADGNRVSNAACCAFIPVSNSVGRNSIEPANMDAL